MLFDSYLWEIVSHFGGLYGSHWQELLFCFLWWQLTVINTFFFFFFCSPVFLTVIEILFALVDFDRTVNLQSIAFMAEVLHSPYDFPVKPFYLPFFSYFFYIFLSFSFILYRLLPLCVSLFKEKGGSGYILVSCVTVLITDWVIY